MRDGCLCACVAVQTTMVNVQSRNASKVVRGLLALTLMTINVQTGGIKGERKKLPRTLSDTPYPKAQRQCFRAVDRAYAEDSTKNGSSNHSNFSVVCPW
jgi:hypothetical protein